MLGMQSQLRRKSSAAEGMAVFLHGSGEFGIQAQGVSQHQNALREVLPANLELGQSQPCVATLVLTGRQSYERNWVSIVIEHRTIGYCPADFAAPYRAWLQRWRLESALVQCRATIIRARGNPGIELRYGARLDVELPFKMTTTNELDER